MDIDHLAAQALRSFPRNTLESSHSVQPLPGLRLLRHPRPTAFEASIYEPVICLIVQGKKETTLGDRTLTAAAGSCLLVSHDLPVVSRVLKAPYLALLLDVEVGLLRGLYDEVADTEAEPPSASALEVHPSDPPLLDALHRYLALARSPRDARVLGPLIRKEIHYRLLTAPSGGMLRHLVRHDSHASAVARAIAQIRRDYRATIAIPELARSVGMSASSFHKHFKSVTSASPLQFQKDLRLIAARRLLLVGEASVSNVAFEVGYESPSQFTREYTRKFGVPPSRDLASTAPEPPWQRRPAYEPERPSRKPRRPPVSDAELRCRSICSAPRSVAVTAAPRWRSERLNPTAARVGERMTCGTGAGL